MDGVFVLTLVAVLVIAIVMGIGPQGMTYWGIWLKCKLMQLRKTKTEPTVSDSRDS